MARRRHSKKEVEGALQYAEKHGWTVSDTSAGHRWSVAVCPGDCTPPTSIWSTPECPLTMPGRSAETLIAARTGKTKNE